VIDDHPRRRGSTCASKRPPPGTGRSGRGALPPRNRRVWGSRSSFTEVTNGSQDQRQRAGTRRLERR